MRHPSMVQTRRVIELFVLAFILVGGGNALGQVDTGTILGTVGDQSGSAVAGAKVTLTNEGTGISITAESRADGSYIFTTVRIGTYTVSAEFRGFQTSRQLHLTLNIQQQVVVDFSLRPGQVTETVVVSAIPDLLQRQSGSLGHVVGTREINDLPLNGRNRYLGVKVPGATQPRTSDFSARVATNSK